MNGALKKVEKDAGVREGVNVKPFPQKSDEGIACSGADRVKNRDSLLREGEPSKE